MEKNNKAILVGANWNQEIPIEYTMEELALLAKACELDPVHSMIQNLDRPTPNFYIGPGKVEELKVLCEEMDIEIVIFNDELSPAHIRNLEKVLECRVIDRTFLILDIFAQRAKTREAMLQVELAQLQYMLPRLVGLSRSFSRQAGGAKLRGPGEKKLELDRRRILRDISNLKHELKDLTAARSVQREKRRKNNIPIVALVGYTNAGKSSLLNTIMNWTHSSEKVVFEKDMLFATLETSTRNITIDNKSFLLTDTVGFVSKLPHHLIEAFKSTLEEVKEADLLIHVVDRSNPEYKRQMEITEEVLNEIGIKNIPMLYALNKMDKLEETVTLETSRSFGISTKTNLNIDLLVNEMMNILFANLERVEMLIPYNQTNVFSFLKENTNVIAFVHQEEGIQLTVELDEELKNKYKQYII